MDFKWGENKHYFHPNQISALNQEFLTPAESVFDQSNKSGKEEEKVQEFYLGQTG